MLLEVIKHYSRQKIHFAQRGMGSVLSNLTLLLLLFFLWNVQVNNENKKIKDTLFIIVTTNKITKPTITMPKLQNLSYYKPKYCLKNFRFCQLNSNTTLRNVFLICLVNIYIYIYIYISWVLKYCFFYLLLFFLSYNILLILGIGKSEKSHEISIENKIEFFFFFF